MLYKISKFFLYLVPFTVIVVSQSTLFPFIVGKYVFFRVVVGLALIFFVWGWATNRKQETGNRKQETSIPSSWLLITNPLVIAVSIFVLIFLLAGFFGYNPSASFWSNFERGEGGLQLLTLFIFFLLLVLLFKDKESWRRMFTISILAAILVIAYGIAGALGIGNFVGQNLCLRFSGSLGNPSYTGTYMIFALFYTAYLFTIEYQHKSAFNQHKPRTFYKEKVRGKSASFKKWLWISLLVLFFIFLLLTQTRGALLGLGAAGLIFLGYLFFVLPPGRTRKIILILLGVLIILGYLGFIFRRSINLMPFCSPELGGGNRILDINLKTETFQTRLLLWKQAIKITKERPLLGWGPENFSAAFEKHYDYRFEVWYDRAHNIFFDYLTQTGILGLLSYLSIFIVFYWQMFRTGISKQELVNRERKQTLFPSSQLLVTNALIFALPIAYLVQGIVLFEVLPIYINLFLFLAFANYINRKQETGTSKQELGI